MFLTFFTFFQNRPGGHTPKPIFTHNVSNDVDPRIDVPFAVKWKLFQTPDHQAPKTAKIWHFWGGTKFSLDFAFNL